MRAPLICVAAMTALVCAACLEPGRPVLATLDNDPPEFVSSDPPDKGTFDRGGFIVITFSERMDERSLRPGIWLREGAERVLTLVQIPEDDGQGVPAASQQTDVPYAVKVGGESPLKANGNYTLVLDSVLTDVEGNQLAGADGGTQVLLTFKASP